MFQKGYIRMLHTKVVVVGSINMDLVTRATQPRAGETLLGSSFHRYMGGKGANQELPPHA